MDKGGNFPPLRESQMTQIETTAKTVTGLQEPPQYRVVYMNDDKTPAEFVMTSLIDVFDYAPGSAEEITWSIHNNGSAVVAVLPYEVAEQKGVEVTMAARQEGYPLQLKLEPEVV